VEDYYVRSKNDRARRKDKEGEHKERGGGGVLTEFVIGVGGKRNYSSRRGPLRLRNGAENIGRVLSFNEKGDGKGGEGQCLETK